ncbi:MAG: DUF6282 family protein [Peptococcaceae bacterium]
MLQLREKALELIKGGYDLHTHTTPSHFKRVLDDLQIVKEADDIGMAGVMLKNHYEPTGARAELINRISNIKAKAYGGLVLNWPVGGLNPYAVESALKMGARIVWMPTRDSENSLIYGDMPGDFFKRSGITVFSKQKALLPVIYEIFEVVKKYDSFLATGHLSPEQSVLLCKEGRKMGVSMILTHPEWERTVVDLQTQLDLADLGVLIEKNWLNIAEGQVSAAKVAESMHRLGPGRVFMATDRGQSGMEHPAEAMLRFIETMLAQDIPVQHIHDMVCTVPMSIVKEN